MAVAVRESVTERIWHPSIQVHRLGGSVLVGGEELAVMSYVVCCIKLQGDFVPCRRSVAPFDRSVTGDTGESGLLIVSSRLGCIQVAVIHRRGRAEEGSWV